jgi:tetraacyldisaccharide 4'-kinase
MIKYLRLLLLPFSVLYGLVIWIRNMLYDRGIFKSTHFDLPVICVGNLVVGGSGKSPVTEYLVNLLQDKRIAILSRGYGRSTTGFILADEKATAQSIGDEPMQFYSKFPQVTVAVCEDRVKGINRLKDGHDLIILDDAYQHRAVQPGFSILLFEFQKLLKPQFLLPAGNLREPFKGYKRAQALLITKVPALAAAAEVQACKQRFGRDAERKLSFSSLAYQDMVHLISGEKMACGLLAADTEIFLLTGIANPEPLLKYLLQFSPNIQHHDYPDHYQFSEANIQKLVSAYENGTSIKKIIITTEKDAQRLLGDTLKELLLNLPIFYLPVKIAIQAEDKVTFDQKILEYVSSTTRNR